MSWGPDDPHLFLAFDTDYPVITGNATPGAGHNTCSCSIVSRTDLQLSRRITYEGRAWRIYEAIGAKFEDCSNAPAICAMRPLRR